MANNVIGLFDNEDVASQVVDDLANAGFRRDSITRFEGDNSDLEGELRREGIPDDEASYYVNGLSEGGALISVRAGESETDTAVEIMNRYANTNGDADYTADYDSATAGTATGLSSPSLDTDLSTDADTIGADTTGADTTGYDAARPVTTEVTDSGVTSGATGNYSAAGDDEARLDVVEERLRIGKREVNRGGVRVRRYVTETPVEEQVTLRDETIHVDRRPVDRTVGGIDSDLFTEQTFEFTETDEEAVIAKEARVVEEVVVGKDVEERTETVRDTVRRTDVEVEQLSGGDLHTGASSYDESDPSYIYGRTLASDDRYRGREWVDIETDARRDWETQNQGGVWDDFKDSIRGSWERSRGRA